VSGSGAVVAAVALTGVAGVSAAAEVAVATISRLHADDLVRQHRRNAQRLRAVSEDPARFLNTATLVRAAAETAATVLVVLALQTVLPTPWALLLAAAVMTLVSFVVVGVAPRTLARRRPEQVALALSRPLVVATRVLGPVPAALIALGGLLVGRRGVREGPFATEARLREMVDLAEQHSAIEADERVMIQRVFDLGDTLVREVMVPRTDIVAIDAGRSVEAGEDLLLRSGFSRLPVNGAGGSDDVLGFVYLKDLTKRLREDPDCARAPVESAVRPPVFVPDSKPADDLLRDMQRERVHIAVVVDEYGGTAGLVTIEDILEEIVGEITDEYDVAVAGPEQDADGTLHVTSRMALDDLGELLGVELVDEDVDTVGGLLAKGLGLVPVPGLHTEISGLYLEAGSRGGRRNRIASVLVRRLGEHDEPGAAGADAEHRNAEHRNGEHGVTDGDGGHGVTDGDVGPAGAGTAAGTAEVGLGEGEGDGARTTGPARTADRVG